MASPAPSSPPDLRPNASELNYFIVSVAAVALLLLLYNAVAVGWCAQHRPLWWSRRFQRGNGRGPAQNSQLTWSIPVYKYRKEEAGAQEKGPDDGGQCAVCLSAFVEGEDVRRLPKCGHSFHASCIDMWLCSRASCPLCRASVAAALQPSPVPAAEAEEAPARPPADALSSSSAPDNPALVMALM